MTASNDLGNEIAPATSQEVRHHRPGLQTTVLMAAKHHFGAVSSRQSHVPFGHGGALGGRSLSPAGGGEMAEGHCRRAGSFPYPALPRQGSEMTRCASNGHC